MKGKGGRGRRGEQAEGVKRFEGAGHRGREDDARGEVDAAAAAAAAAASNTHAHKSCDISRASSQDERLVYLRNSEIKYQEAVVK